jgi:hypothetical protein
VYSTGTAGGKILVPPSRDELEAALRTIARALAPFVAEELRGEAYAADALEAGDGDGGPLDRLEEQLRRLSPEALSGAMEFLLLLSREGEIDSVTLADRTGLSQAALSGTILRPLRQALEQAGMKKLWREGGRRAHRGTIWLPMNRETAGQMGERLHALLAKVEEGRRPARGESEITAVFPWAPEYVARIEDDSDGGSSCLRDTTRGTRAAIYQVHRDQAVVALFDATQPAEPDPDWGYHVKGRFTLVPSPVPRQELLSRETFRPIFQNMQGRRHLERRAQTELTALLEANGGFRGGRLPPHAIDRETSQSRPPQRRSRHR